MSARFNLILSFGVLAVMLLTSMTTIYFTREGKLQSEQNNQDIEELEKQFNNFVNMWENRIKTSNTVNNSTQLKISNAVNDIIGNLSSHREVTNITSAEISKLQNQTSLLIKQFNETNEVERAKAVDKILEGIQNNTEILETLQNKT